MRYPRVRNEETNEFRKESLRLVKEVAEDEVELGRAIDFAYECKTDVDKERAECKVDYLERRMDRKLRMLDTLIGRY